MTKTFKLLKEATIWLSIIAIVALVVNILVQGIFDGFSNDYSKELSGNYSFEGESIDSKGIFNNRVGKRDILGKVTKYDWDNNFIVAMQEPSRETHIDYLTYHIYTEYSLGHKHLNTANDIYENELIADSIFNNSSYYLKIFSNKVNYWIVDVREEIIYGPFIKEEYIFNRKKLGVPNDLKI